MLQLIAKTEINDGSTVEIFRTAFGYAVRYGLQVKSTLTLELAMREYTSCIRHALNSAGIFDEDQEEA
jgi:hypothetical protein